MRENEKMLILTFADPQHDTSLHDNNNDLSIDSEFFEPILINSRYDRNLNTALNIILTENE